MSNEQIKKNEKSLKYEPNVRVNGDIDSISRKKLLLRLYSSHNLQLPEDCIFKNIRHYSTMITQKQMQNFYQQSHQQDIQNYNFEALDRQNTVYKFVANEWIYLGKGADHYVFHNKNANSDMADKVLIFGRKVKSAIDQQIHNHYMSDIMQDQISVFLNLGIKIWPKNKHSKKVLNLLKNEKQQIDFSTDKFTIADNLFQNRNKQWDVILQFKPKSLMPSKYGLQTIQNVAQFFNVDVDLIIQQINNCDVVQKLTWFKKVAYTSKKLSVCPLEVFAGISYPNISLNFSKTEFYKQILCQISNQKLNEFILSQLRNSNVLNLIHKINGVYTQPNLYGIFEGVETYQKLPVQLPKIIKDSKQYFPIQHTISFLNKINCVQPTNYNSSNQLSLSAKFERLYRLSIFRCWNDISLVVKLKLNEQKDKVIESKINILDFQLWQIQNLIKRTPSERQYLKRYLEFKSIETKGPPLKQKLTKNSSNTIQLYEKSYLSKEKVCIESKNIFIYAIPKILKQQTIKILMLDRNNLQDQDIKLLTQSKWPNLNHISLNCNQINLEGCNFLAKCEWPSLKFLSISSNQITNQGLKILSTACWNDLQQIYFDWNNITQDGLQHLGRWKNLIALRLAYCKIELRGVIKLINAGFSKIKYLNLHNNKIRIAGLSQLSKGNWDQLQCLILSKNHLRKQLCQSNPLTWPKLKHLDISLNAVFVSNFQVMKNIQTCMIQELKVCSNKINAEGVKNLMQTNFKCLKKLDLFNNQIQNQGIKFLCEKQWPNLQYLNLARNEITDHGIQHLQVSSLPNLQKIVLYHNKISIKGVQKLVFFKWSSIQFIDLCENSIKNSELKKLIKQLPIENKNIYDCLLLH